MNIEFFKTLLSNLGTYITVKNGEQIVYTNVPIGFMTTNDNASYNNRNYMENRNSFAFEKQVYDVITYTDVTELKEKINKDFKTGALSAEGFNEKVIELITAREPFVLGMFDIDFFKQFNDTYGHDVGDKVLSAITGIFKHNLKTKDFIGRFGGDEFIFVMPHASDKVAADRVQLILDRINKGIKCDDLLLNVTLSVGLRNYDYDLSYQDNANKTDELLYKSKENGRNRITIEDQKVLKKI